MDEKNKKYEAYNYIVVSNVSKFINFKVFVIHGAHTSWIFSLFFTIFSFFMLFVAEIKVMSTNL